MINKLIAVLIVILLSINTISCVCVVEADEEFLNVQQVADLIIEKVFSRGLYDIEGLRFREMGNIPTCRDEFRFALCLLSSNKENYHELGNSILRKYLVSQVRNTDNPYYGSWRYPEYVAVDEGLEWDMFIPLIVFQIWFDVRDRLEEDVIELMQESIVICSKGLVLTWFSDYRSTLSHTNYHLMFVADLLISSEISGNGIGEGFAKIAFDAFVEWTLENGITEFNSPTYLAVDLQALYSIERYSTDETMRKVAQNWIDFILTDAMIHFVGKQNWMCGANSRSYNVIAGTGGTVLELVRLIRGGLTKDMIGSVGDISTCYFDYTFPSWMDDLMSRIDREFLFQSRWSDDPWAIRKTYFDQSFTVGSTGRSYGAQDRTVVIDLSRKTQSSCQLVPVISVNDNPSRLPSLGGGSGHNHLNIPIFCDHNANKLIQLSHIRFKGNVTSEINRLALTFIVPIESEIEYVKGEGFAVYMPDSKAFIAPFFLKQVGDYSAKYKFRSDNMSGCRFVDFELARFDEGIVSIDDVFVGFAMEVYDSATSINLKEWLLESDLRVMKNNDIIECGFGELSIDYSIHDQYPLNMPLAPPEYICYSPFTCVSNGVFYVLDREIPLRRFDINK